MQTYFSMLLLYLRKKTGSPHRYQYPVIIILLGFLVLLVFEESLEGDDSQVFNYFLSPVS